MRTLRLVLLLGLFVWIYASLGSAQDTLSVQVLRLLARANSWTAIQIFTVDPQISTIHTTAPTGTDCDATGETGKLYFDSTADFVYICSGVSGWRKITAAAP